MARLVRAIQFAAIKMDPPDEPGDDGRAVVVHHLIDRPPSPMRENNDPAGPEQKQKAAPWDAAFR
jgi:hypothetical protein